MVKEFLYHIVIKSVSFLFDVFNLCHLLYLFFKDNTEWANETPSKLWKKITEEVSEYFDYKLDW